MGTVAPLLIAGHWQAAQDSTGSFRAFDPASGDAIGPAFPRSGAADVEQALAASAAAPQLATAAPERIAAFLDAYATALEVDADTLVQLAHAETGLPATPRLRGNELPRTCNQLRQAANAVRNRSWTQPVIDTAATPTAEAEDGTWREIEIPVAGGFHRVRVVAGEGRTLDEACDHTTAEVQANLGAPY